MPKENLQTFVGRVVKEHPNDFQTDGSVFFCKLCDICQINVASEITFGNRQTIGQRESKQWKKRWRNKIAAHNNRPVRTKIFMIRKFLASCFVKSTGLIHRYAIAITTKFFPVYTNHLMPY